MDPASFCIHLGVYGVIVQDGHLLVIEKTRGPYTGLYDLPGGGVEAGETVEGALRRELDEEVGASLNACYLLAVNEYRCRYDVAGVMMPFHHIGIYFRAEVAIDALRTEPDGHDSGGARWVPLRSLAPTRLAPIAWPVVRPFTRT